MFSRGLKNFSLEMTHAAEPDGLKTKRESLGKREVPSYRPLNSTIYLLSNV